ncbi:MAG: PqqD family protein [Polyangiaceae bacterium]
MQLADSSKLTVPPEVLSRVLDGEAVLLHLGSGTYFGMNEVASRAWEEIVKGTTLAALVTTLLAEFDVERATLVGDLDRFVRALLDKSLITIAPPA